jgi:hypothetical protein
LDFADKALLQTHLQDRHPEILDSLQLPVLLDICERPKNMDTKTECPLCFDILSLEALHTHLAAHLEELALFILPLDPSNSTDDGNSDSAKPVLQNKTHQDFDDLSSLGPFSDVEATEPPTQDPQTFKLLLKQYDSASNVDEDERNPSSLSSGTWLTLLESEDKLQPEDGWIISTDEKHQCNLIFEAIDSDNRGFVARRDFVHYLRDFANRDTLKRIWQSTSDYSNSSLGQDEFAIAMHLLEINQENYSVRTSSASSNRTAKSSRLETVLVQLSFEGTGTRRLPLDLTMHADQVLPYLEPHIFKMSGKQLDCSIHEIEITPLKEDGPEPQSCPLSDFDYVWDAMVQFMRENRIGGASKKTEFRVSISRPPGS